MKKIKVLLSLPLLTGVLLLSSFSPNRGSKANATVIENYAWYTPSGEFVAWSTLVNSEIVTGDNTNPTGGTLALEGYTGGNEGEPPSGTLVYKLYSHP
jgi:hypothetical protein